MLDIQVDLSITVDGEPVSVRSEGDTLVATFRSVRCALRVLRTLPLADGLGRLATLRTASGTVKASGVNVLARVGHRMVARAGPAAQPGWLSRVLRLGEVELYARDLALAALGR